MRARSKSEFKRAIRDEAKRKVGTAKYDLTSQRQYREIVEEGHRELMRKSSEGGDSRGKRVRNELTYLLNNYLPQYDMRIEFLIAEWRKSGDPSYDPSIHIRLRQARQEHMSKSNPA